MTIEQFSAVSHNVQEVLLKLRGILLLNRQVEDLQLLLYQIDGFYVKVTCTTPNRIRLINSCTLQEIDDFLASIDISSITKLVR